MQTMTFSRKNLLTILSIVLIGFSVLASCTETDPQQGMPGHMTLPRITILKWTLRDYERLRLGVDKSQKCGIIGVNGQEDELPYI